MARLVPPDEDPVEPGLATVRGWLSADDPFFAAVEEIVTERVKHRPRTLRKRPASRKP